MYESPIDLRSVKVCFLDAGNTMLQADPPVEVRYAATAAQHGIVAPPAEIRERFAKRWRDVREERARRLFSTDQEQTRQFWRTFVADIFSPWAAPGPTFDAFFRQLYDDFASRAAWRLYEDVLPTLAALQTMGLRLGVISNWDMRLPQLLSTVGLERYFEAVVVSAQEGREKPAPEIFLTALERVGVAPHEALHVGDSLEEDVVGALAVGLRAAHLKRSDGPVGTPGADRYLTISTLAALPGLLAAGRDDAGLR